MYAVIATGGKQYKVQANDIVDVELVNGNDGDKIEFNEVLAVGDENGIKVGSPTLTGAKVEAEIVEHFRGDKVIAFKMKRRKGYRHTIGHRQNLLKVKILSITL